MMELKSYQFVFFEKPDEWGYDGYVRYDFKMKHEGLNEWHDTSIRQPFSNGSNFVRRGDNTPIWAWDGNRESPTLTPSFLYDAPPAGKLHLFVRKGELDILADTTVSHDNVVKL